MDAASVQVRLWPTRGAADAGGEVPPTPAPPTAAVRGRAYRLLMLTVAEVTGVAVAEVSLGREPAGRPVVTGPAAAAGVHVSLAHTPGLVAVAVSTLAEVGVDVETQRSLDAVRLARRWLNEDDVRWLVEVDEPQRSAAFLWLWTHKEALGKMQGVGLRGSSLKADVPRPTPWQLPPPIEAATPLTALNDGSAVTGAFRAPAGHQVAVALAGAGEPPGTDPWAQVVTVPTDWADAGH